MGTCYFNGSSLLAAQRFYWFVGWFWLGKTGFSLLVPSSYPWVSEIRFLPSPTCQWEIGKGNHAPGQAALRGDHTQPKTSYHRALITRWPPLDLFPWGCLASSLQDWLPPTSSQVGTCLHLCLGEAADGPITNHLCWLTCRRGRRGAQGQLPNTHTKKMPNPLSPSAATSLALSLPGIWPRREPEQMLGI